MSLIDQFTARAMQDRKKIVFPEGDDSRVLAAAARLRRQGIACPILLGSPSGIEAAARAADITLDGIEIVDPRNDVRAQAYGQACATARKSLSASSGVRLMSKPLYFAGMMVRQGDAHAMVAGAAHSTRRVIEAGLLTIGLDTGISVPSSYFLMLSAAQTGHAAKPMLFADCAVNISPTDQELADIAVSSLRSARALLDEPVRVAMLSFSTKGSAQHPAIDTVKRALEIARAREPGAMIDGEFQADTALSPSVAQRKLTDLGEVAGRANVLIFPDLNAGNIGYKLVQQLTGAKALGPFLQGFSKPISDLSRGATIDEIILTSTLLLASA